MQKVRCQCSVQAGQVAEAVRRSSHRCLRRQRDALANGKNPAKLKETLLEVRPPTLREIGWLAKRPRQEQRCAEERPFAQKLCKHELLQRFGLGEPGELCIWVRRAQSKKPTGLDEYGGLPSGDDEAALSSDDLDG